LKHHSSSQFVGFNTSATEKEKIAIFNGKTLAAEKKFDIFDFSKANRLARDLENLYIRCMRL